MMSQIDHRKSFETLFEADASIFRDVILRRLLIGVTSVFFSLFLDTGIYALWGAGYVIGDYFYVRLLRHPLDKVSRLRFWIACMASITLALWIAAMATYLSFVNGGEMHAIAACVVVGQALHCLSSHNKFGAAVNLDLTAVSLSTAGVTLGTAFNVQSASLAPAIIFAALAVTIYFIHSVRKAIAERMALHKRVEAEVQDQKMKALGQFTSGVAHDFNNMLTVIGGNIELARLHTLPPPSQEVLDEALNASENAAGLVKQLLAYSRKSTLQADQIEANALITRVAKVASRLLPANVALETVTIKTPTYVNADQSMLETAILNLVLNARDALTESGGTITIKTRKPHRESMVALTVEDTGPGMSFDVLSNATDPFFTTKPMGQGSGLGLSMVNGFAEQSGGHLTLKNLVTGGLQANIFLPLRSADPAQPKATAGRTQAAQRASG